MLGHFLKPPTQQVPPMYTEQTLNCKTSLLVGYGPTAKDQHLFEDSFQHERPKLALSLKETHLQESEKNKLNNVFSKKEQSENKRELFEIKKIKAETKFSVRLRR